MSGVFFLMSKESADALHEWLLKEIPPTWTTNVTPRVADPEPGYDFVARKRRKGKRK